MATSKTTCIHSSLFLISRIVFFFCGKLNFHGNILNYKDFLSVTVYIVILRHTDLSDINCNFPWPHLSFSLKISSKNKRFLNSKTHVIQTKVFVPWVFELYGFYCINIGKIVSDSDSPQFSCSDQPFMFIFIYSLFWFGMWQLYIQIYSLIKIALMFNLYLIK